MNVFALRRRTPLVAALAVASLFSCSASAQDNAGEVLVVGSRFPADPAFAPIGATVITATQIREAGVTNVNEAIRKIAGVYGRQSLTGSPDYSLDLRGFGSSSDQNTVVMIDGVRLSENELVSPALSSIPIESVERIEIVRGGSSVLYGEGATGGTIQIITKRANNKLHGTAFGEAGSYGQREGRASIAGGSGAFSADANVDLQHADNYRANETSKQKNFSGGLQWAADGARLGLRVDSSRQDARFPGSLTLAQFEADPRKASTPNDFGSTGNDRYTLSAQKRWGDMEAAAELSRRNRTAEATYISSFGDYVRRDEGQVTQFSPRLRYLSTSSAGTENEFVTGVDIQHWTRNTNATSGGFPASDADASQKSRGLYVRDEIKFDGMRIAAGARHETFDKRFADPLSFSNTAYDDEQSLNAWELQGDYTVASGIDLFAKAGRSYRVANVDEDALTPLFNQALKPQISHDAELGATLGKGQDSFTFKLFRHRLTDEIYYDPTAGLFGANSNLPATRRQGVELDGSAHLSKDFLLSAHAQHVDATFSEGPNAGRDVPLVPRNTATVRLNWLPHGDQSADVGLRWVDSQRYGGDFDNSCTARMPAFTLLDARYAHRFGGWEFALSGNNLTDRKYFSNAFGACSSGIYPDPGRQLMFSARLDF